MSSGAAGVKAPEGAFSRPVSGICDLNASMALIRASSRSRKPLIAAAWLPGWMNFLKMNRRTNLDPAQRFFLALFKRAAFSLSVFPVFAASLSARPTKVSIFQSSERWVVAGMVNMPPSFKVFTSKSVHSERWPHVSGGARWYH